MILKKYIPNSFTFLNLLCGTIATIFAVKGELELAAYFVFFGIFFDFFDGFFARLFNVSGELGKQLDSLADVVTSGVAPGIVMFQLILFSLTNDNFEINSKKFLNIFSDNYFSYQYFIALFGLIFTLASAYRLAKFNIDERQMTSFVGLPTPAASLVVLSLPLIISTSSNEFVINLIQSTWFLIPLTLSLSYLMNAEIPLFSLKFKEYSWKNNKIKFGLLIFSVLFVLLFKFVAIPLIVFLYISLSVIENRLQK